MNIFKVEYHWYDDDCGSTLLGKEVEREAFEKDLKEAIAFAESLKGIAIENYDYLGKGYSVECLPEYYGQIVWYFTHELGYIELEMMKERYDIDDDQIGKGKISATRITGVLDMVIL